MIVPLRTTVRRLALAGLGVAVLVCGLLPAVAATASTATYAQISLPATIHTGDRVILGVNCTGTTGTTTCPTGGTGTVSIDGTQVGTLTASSAPVQYTYNWTATGPAVGSATTTTHTFAITFAESTTDPTAQKVSFTGQLSVVAATVPTAVQNLAVAYNPTTNHGSATWTAPATAGSSAVTGYQVKVDSGNTRTQTSLSFDVTYITAGTHTITVAAVNSGGAGPTTTLSFVRPATTVPGAPVELQNNDGANASVDWNPPNNDGGARITQYNVQVDGGTIYTTSTDNNSFSLSGVTGMTYGTHTVAVAAVNSNGAGPAATVTVNYFTTPAAPTNIVVQSPSAAPLVTFTAADPRGAAITEYDYYVDSTSSGIKTLPANTTSFTLSGLSAGTHTLGIAARNSAGLGSYATVQFQFTTMLAPDSPQNISVDTTGRHAVLNWAAPANNGGATIDQYVVTVDGAAACSAVVVTSCDLSYLAPGSHNVTVAAHNTVGTGTPSKLTFTRPLVYAPDAVGNMAVTSGPSPSVSWSVPVNDGGRTISGYTVAVDGGTPITVAGINSTSMTFDGSTLAYGPHTVTVQAVNNVGASAAAGPTNLVFESQPTAPTAVQVQTGTATPDVSWNPSVIYGGSVLYYSVFLDGVAVGDTPDGFAADLVLPVEPPGKHTVTVTATSKYSTSPVSTAVDYVAPNLPGPISNLTATAPVGLNVHVAWSDPSTDGGAPISGYRITVDPAGSSQIFAAPGSATMSYDLPVPLSPGAHTIVVQALNGVGPGPSSTTHVTLRGSVILSLDARSAPPIGGLVTLTGVATTTGSAPVANLPITLYSAAVGGSLVAGMSAQTDANGNFTFTVAVPAGKTFQVQTPGDNQRYLNAASSFVITVLPTLRATLTQTTATGARLAVVKAKTTMRYTVVSPGAPAGTQVQLQIKFGSGTWHGYVTTTATHGTARLNYSFTKRGSYQIRAKVIGVPNVTLSVLSRTVTLKVV